MKKILLLLIIAFLALSSFSQTQPSAHLTFKGVPIDGTLNEFVLKMKDVGFTLLKTDNGFAILNGEFAGYKDCILIVGTLEEKDLVARITVLFPELGNWSPLSYNYFMLKELLTEKYGQPSESVEKFEPYEPGDDGSRMSAVKSDMCKYSTTYDTELGTIVLSIDQRESESRVALVYRDKINVKLIKAKVMEDL